MKKILKGLEKLFFESRFLFYGFATGLLVSLIAVNPIIHMAIIAIALPFIFLADQKFVKGGR
jgi:hypothetical protein